MAERYYTDTNEFGKRWNEWLKGKSEDYLATDQAGKDFIAHMREEFDKVNKDYSKDKDSAIVSKANYVNTQLKKNGFETLYLPSVGKPGKKRTLKDIFKESSWAKEKK